MKAYQFKITIKNSHPPIWRRVIIPAGITFSQLSIILNEVMGWCGYHMSSFEFRNLNIYIEDEPEDIGWGQFETLDGTKTIIDKFFDDEKRLVYIYDFGDFWEHKIEIEKVLFDYEKEYPIVVKFKGDTPYEDCGGIYGYYELLEILDNPKHPQYEDMSMWVEGHFHNDYDIDCANKALEDLELVDEDGNPLTQREIYEIMFDKYLQ